MQNPWGKKIKSLRFVPNIPKVSSIVQLILGVGKSYFSFILFMSVLANEFLGADTGAVVTRFSLAVSLGSMFLVMLHSMVVRSDRDALSSLLTAISISLEKGGQNKRETLWSGVFM
jgi:hypothetical protein